MYIWDLEKWYWWTNLQGKNEDADIEKGFVDTVEEGESMMGQHVHITMCKNQQLVRSCYVTQGAQPRSLWCFRGVGWVRREGGPRGRLYRYNYGWYVLLHGRSQPNIVKQFPPIKNEFFKKKESQS